MLGRIVPWATGNTPDLSKMEKLYGISDLQREEMFLKAAQHLSCDCS